MGQDAVETRKLNDEQVKRIISNEDYHYGRKDLSGERKRRSAEMMRDFLKSLEKEAKEEAKKTKPRSRKKSNNNSGGGGLLSGFLKYLLIGGVIALVIYGLIQVQKNPVLVNSDEELVESDYLVSGEELEQLDKFELLIRDAVRQQNYRAAVRLHFLRILRTLSENKMIDWQIDKTNYDYYLELKGSTFEKDFMKVSVNFEYVWYGEFTVEEAQYEELVKQFNKFKSELEQRNG
jgi:hypothetical protein